MKRRSAYGHEAMHVFPCKDSRQEKPTWMEYSGGGPSGRAALLFFSFTPLPRLYRCMAMTMMMMMITFKKCKQGAWQVTRRGRSGYRVW